MVEFTEEEKSHLLQLIEDIARTNREIASHLAIANAQVIGPAFERAFKDNAEREVYTVVNGKLSIRQIADALNIGKAIVQRRIDWLASKGFIEKNDRDRYQKTLSKAEIVQRFSKSNEEQ